MRKRIAVLVAQIDETTQKRFLMEFIRQAYALDYDVCIFSMFQKYQETWLRGIGDSNIFALVNFELFDAVTILLDTILTPGLAMPLQEMVRDNFDGPVLVVDQESPYFDTIMIDHYTPMRKLIDHLIDVHGYKEIAFLGGKKGHPHSVQRLRAFQDSMFAHGLLINDAWVYHGNYWYDSAEEFAELLLKDREHLPQALACANDCMAIGAAAWLTERGIRIPEDIAVIGYDSLEDGRLAPTPLTSASIPADECGQYCMRRLDAEICEKITPRFETRAPLFIGASCGCRCETEVLPSKLRPVWRTQQSARSLFSDFNHIIEDLLSQYDMRSFLETVQTYAYQIRPFYSFDLCMNADFLKAECNIGEKAIRKGYTDTMYHVLSCGATDDEDVGIDFARSFPTEKLLPALMEERAYPTTYIFTPLYFDDRCFGYTVLNYGREIRLYDERYRIWMRNLMQGMEAFYRQQYLQTLFEQIKADQVRDTLTGLYNYEGFIKEVKRMLSERSDPKFLLHIISVDIKGIKVINEVHGRKSGERAIRTVARLLQQALREEEICCRMCNDEFLIALWDLPGGARAQSLTAQLSERVEQCSLAEDPNYMLHIHTMYLSGLPEDTGALEAMINHTISMKNHKKTMQWQADHAQKEVLMDEIRRNQLVSQMLNENTMTYYYQPIVSARDGSVFGYEALMRYEDEEISPLQILQASAYLNRLQDVERATLLNVTADVEAQADAFGDAKVFINSLPGVNIPEQDDREFEERMRKNRGRFVIEFTEESELDDAQLEKLKEKFAFMGNEIAVDDYGAGYSNVNNLLRYMPQYVKIDRQLIAQIESNPQKQHFVYSIIQFALGNDICTLAEGVETREELKMCIRLGIDLIQGFYTGRPTREPVGEIDEEIQEEIRCLHRQSKEWQAKYFL